MASVDVDMDVFSNEEILMELKYRLLCDWTSKQKKIELRQKIKDCLNIEINNSNTKLSLIDAMKIEFITENINKISLDDLKKLAIH